MDVESLAQILGAHGRALGVPAGETHAPGGVPAHDVFGLRLLPKGEVAAEALLLLAVEVAGGGEHLLNHAAAQAAVALEILVVFAHIEIDAAVAHIGITGIKDFLHQLNLLHHMAGGQRLDAGAQHVQLVHGLVVAVGVVLRHLHGLQLLQAGLLGNLVLAFVSIVFQVTHIGDVAHIAHLIAQMHQVAVQHIESDGGPGVAQMTVAIDGGTADIHAHVVGSEGFEKLFLVRKSIVNQQWLHNL